MQFPVTYQKRFQEDMINRMPENVISNIMDRLPIQEAVRTSILSRNRRFTWTLITQLVFDYKFFRYLRSKKHIHLFYKRDLGKVLLQLKGSITKFVLYIPDDEDDKHKKEYDEMHDDIVNDINHWILFLSTKGLQKFSLINMGYKPLKLPNHLFSCLELKHLKLRNCDLYPVPGFHCLPKLLGFDFEDVVFESCKYGEFIAMCPLLEHLKFDRDTICGEVKLGEIAKAINLKVLSLLMYKLADIEKVTSSDILQLVDSLPKLEMLTLDFIECSTVLAKAGASNRFSGNLHHLMKLSLEIDYEDGIMVEFACDLINGLPNLQTLEMKWTEYGSETPDVSQVVCSIKGTLQLQYVELQFLGLEIEERFIESLLACSPLLKEMVIKEGRNVDHNNGCCSFARKLLKFHRASPVAEIHLR